MVYSTSDETAANFLIGMAQTIFVLYEVDRHTGAVYYGTDANPAASDFLNRCLEGV